MRASVINANGKQSKAELKVAHVLRRWWARILMCPFSALMGSRQGLHGY